MDNGPMYLLDTFHGPVQEQLTRRVGRVQVQFQVPKALDTYNRFMGGVDRYDQIRTGCCGLEMNGRVLKWTVRAYEALFNMCIANVYALHRHLTAARGDTLTHALFMVRVVEELLDNVYQIRSGRVYRRLEI